MFFAKIHNNTGVKDHIKQAFATLLHYPNLVIITKNNPTDSQVWYEFRQILICCENIPYLSNRCFHSDTSKNTPMSPLMFQHAIKSSKMDLIYHTRLINSAYVSIYTPFANQFRRR
uniref:Uncharacterized protein n=1 Tax=Zea mays TaxID=4577 RepID=C4J3D7_MAIZE|nr:unknown [Zea mays]